MCGIISIVGNSEVTTRILDALKRLEYRGYDSSGIATLHENVILRQRAEGKLNNLEQQLEQQKLPGTVGIGHTRWATHGAPTETNAHPHLAPNDGNPRVAVVHNGIIENFQELKSEFASNEAFSSDTDTEVIAHIIERELQHGSQPIEAVKKVIGKLKGAYALAIIIAGSENIVFGARNGSPLAIGHGEGEMYLGSDAIALVPFTNKVSFLEDGDWVVLTQSNCTIYGDTGKTVTRPIQQINATSSLAEKGNFRHFMAKEIHEQPEVLGHTLSKYVNLADNTIKLEESIPIDISKVNRLVISACGTAFFAGMIAKYWFERYAQLPVDLDVASEFRYREMPLNPNDLAMFISQSGETADTLASLRYCKAKGQQLSAIVNVEESTIARESNIVFPALAGPEIGVASTKAFTCQLVVLAALAIGFGRIRKTISADEESELVGALIKLPNFASQALHLESKVEEIARTLSKSKDILYLGRGTNYPVAMEGALKLKEISYIHAEGYAAGELKHGPIALIDENVPVIIIAPYDHMFEKTFSNMQEVAARGGKIIFLSDNKGYEVAKPFVENAIILPEMPSIITPIVYSIPVQLLAYHTAAIMGTDVDQPRNLAKSVTVE